MENMLRRKAGEGTRYPSISNYVLNTLQRTTLDFNFTKFNSIVIKHNFEKKAFVSFLGLRLHSIAKEAT